MSHFLFDRKATLILLPSVIFYKEGVRFESSPNTEVKNGSFKSLRRITQPKTGATYYHSQERLIDIGRAFKGLVV